MNPEDFKVACDSISSVKIAFLCSWAVYSSVRYVTNAMEAYHLKELEHIRKRYKHDD